MKYVVFLLLFLSLSSLSNSNEQNGIYFTDVAKEKYNRIVLTKPFKRAIISKGAKIDKPIKLNSGRLLLVRPKNTALKSFDITFILEDGETFQLYFNPVVKNQAVVWRYKDAADVQSYEGYTLNDKHIWLSRLFPEAHDVFYNRTPDEIEAPKGFTSVKTPKRLEVNIGDNKPLKIIMTPKKSWRGMGHKLDAYILTSTGPIEIEPQDFWYDGVVAISTEFDYITKSKSPYIFILSKD